jgi:hypothetical protein
MNDIQNKLLEKIKAGEVAMKPRWQFVLQGLLWAGTTIVAALIAVYILSFVLFALHKSGLVFAPLFGWSGIVLFIVSSPWLLIGFVGALLLVLYVLVSHYAFSYRKPLVYSLLGVVLLVIAVASIIQQTNFHGRAGEFFERHEVPGLTPLYRDIEQKPPKDVTRGTLSNLTDKRFTLTTEKGVVYEVEFDEHTKLPPSRELAAGDIVMVFGPMTDTTIKAFGVRIHDDPLPPLHEDGSQSPKLRPLMQPD